MRLLTIPAALVVLAGCATQPQWVWAKQGATEDDFHMDRGQCQAQAFAPGNVNLMQAALIMNGCLKGKGWRQVPLP
jgi:hypothetical protein